MAEAPRLGLCSSGRPKPPAGTQKLAGTPWCAFRRERFIGAGKNPRPRKSALHSREAASRQSFGQAASTRVAAPSMRLSVSPRNRRRESAHLKLKLGDDGRLDGKGETAPRRDRDGPVHRRPPVVLTALALHAPALLRPHEEAAGPPEPVIPVLIMPRVPPAAARLGRTAPADPAAPPPAAPELAAPDDRALRAAGQRSRGAGPSGPARPGRRTLTAASEARSPSMRARRCAAAVGCANAEPAGPDREERRTVRGRAAAGGCGPPPIRDRRRRRQGQRLGRRGSAARKPTMRYMRSAGPSGTRAQGLAPTAPPSVAATTCPVRRPRASARRSAATSQH